MASAPAFILLSTGAVNTFPIPLISLLILIILGQAAKQKEIKTRQAFLIGLIAGLGFHFSSALAIFYLLLMPLSFLILKIKLTVKKILIGAGGLMLSFLPQVLFEIKNNFLQTKGVINYFLTGESQKISLGKIKLVTNSIIHELSLAVLPDILWFKIICLIILLIGLINLIQIRKIESFTKLLVFWLVVPTIGFWWLHFNPWYVYGLLPVVVLLASKILSSLPNRIANVYFSLLVLAVFIKLFNFWQVDRENLLKNKALLPMKLKAINYIYEKAEGAPFSSYHYLPEIYDYAYQYLFFWQGFKGRQIPVEFSYQPGEISYVNEKPDLLEKVDKTEFKAEKIFFIIEKPENKWHYPLDEWLRRIEYSEIVMKESIGPELEVWEALP